MKKSEKRTKVYLLDRNKTADPVSFSSWKDFLPKERWEKTVRPVREEDRKTELTAWLLLDHALKEWGIPEESIRADGAYRYGEHGKPERKKKEVCFNLSHSGKYVMCVVSDVEVGCDIEKIQKVKWKLVKRFFSEGEYDILEKLKEEKREKREKEESPETEEELFTRLWVLRESYVKKTGEGLGTSLEGLDFSGISGYRISGYKGKKNGKALKESFFEWEYDGYRIAVCEEKDCEPEFVVCSRTIDNCFL